MSDDRFDNSSIPPRGGVRRIRDNRGRWVRQSAPVETIAAQASVFDDRIFEGALPPLTEEHLLRPAGTENPAGSAFTAVAAEEASEIPAVPEETDHPIAPVTVVAPSALIAPVTPVEDHRPWAVPTPAWRFRSRPFFLLVGALLLLGVVYLVVQRGSSGAKRAEVAAPPPPPTIVAPVVLPPVPKSAARRQASRAAAAPPLKKDTATAAASAPVVIPQAPQPAMAPKPTVQTSQVEPVAAAAPSLSSQPLPQPLVEGEPAAAGVLPTRTTPDEDGWFNLAEEYLQLGEDKRAEALYRRILDEGTQKGRAALALGDFFAKKNDFNRAQEFYRLSKRFFQDRDQPPSPP